MSSRYILPFADVGSGIKPSSGAKLSFFETDGVTPKDTFSDQLATPTPNANPVIADSNGVFGDIFIVGEYKNTLTDKNDVQIFGGAIISELVTGSGQENNVLNRDTLAIALADTSLADGLAINLAGRNTKDDGGAAIWDTYPAATFTVGAAIFDVFNHDTLPIQLKLRVGDVLDIRQIGVVGDGIVIDNGALQNALKYPNIIGHESLNVRTTVSMFITNPIQWDMAGMKLLGESTGDVNVWLYIRSSNVIVENGQFGDGTVDHGKAIVIGDYGDAELFFRDISILNNEFLMAVLFTQQAVVSGHGRVFELTISGNRFQSTHTYIDAFPSENTAVNNIAAIFMQNGGAALDLDSNQDWTIKDNRCISFPYFFNNQSVGVTSGVVIHHNIVSQAMMAMRVYHMYDTIVSENIFTDCTDTQHIWQRSTYINNKLVRCGLLTPQNRPTFKIEAGTSLNIAGNEIRESLGDGCRIDGGNSDFTFGPNNMIYKSGGAGIVVATDLYPGQITGLSISGNRIVESASHGIQVNCTQAIRGMTITNNHIAANGLNNPGDVAGIFFDNTSLVQLNDITIAFNTIRNNDVVGGIQTAKTKWAVKVDAPGSAFSEVLVTDNITQTELLIEDTRTGGTGTSTAYNNFTLDLTDPQLIGWIWSRNYDRTDIQIVNNRTGFAVIGVLTPLYLGEEVFSTSAQDWYKGVGASLGPWTNTDWKIIT